MKKWEKEWKVWSIAAVAVSGLLFTGCGSSKGYSEAAAADTTAMEMAMYDNGSGAYLSDGVSYEEIAEEDAGEVTDAGGEGASSPQVQDTARKLIKNVNLEVETEVFDELLPAVREKTQQLGGYIEESYTYNGSSYHGNRLRNASLTIRIPADKLEEFLSDMAEVSNVISRNDSVTDVTLQYVDMESHKKVLLAEQERLLELLERAESIEDIISLEGRLSEVRYQLESMESQLRVMDNQVSYSTVYLYIDEVAKLTPVKEQSAWEKISTGFMSSLYDVGNGLEDFGIGLLIDLPYIILWAVVIILLFLVARLVIRRMRKKSGKTKEYPERRRLFGKSAGDFLKKNTDVENPRGEVTENEQEKTQK